MNVSSDFRSSSQSFLIACAASFDCVSSLSVDGLSSSSIGSTSWAGSFRIRIKMHTIHRFLIQSFIYNTPPLHDHSIIVSTSTLLYILHIRRYIAVPCFIIDIVPVFSNWVPSVAECCMWALFRIHHLKPL
eukprot:643109_1